MLKAARRRSSPPPANNDRNPTDPSERTPAERGRCIFLANNSSDGAIGRQAGRAASAFFWQMMNIFQGIPAANMEGWCRNRFRLGWLLGTNSFVQIVGKPPMPNSTNNRLALTRNLRFTVGHLVAFVCFAYIPCRPSIETTGARSLKFAAEIVLPQSQPLVFSRETTSHQ